MMPKLQELVGEDVTSASELRRMSNSEAFVETLVSHGGRRSHFITIRTDGGM